MAFIIVDQLTGKELHTVKIIPQELSGGTVISLRDTYYQCNSEQLGAGRIMTLGEAKAEIRATSNTGIYIVTIEATNLIDFAVLRQKALQALGYTVISPEEVTTDA